MQQLIESQREEFEERRRLIQEKEEREREEEQRLKQLKEEKFQEHAQEVKGKAMKYVDEKRKKEEETKFNMIVKKTLLEMK